MYRLKLKSRVVNSQASCVFMRNTNKLIINLNTNNKYYKTKMEYTYLSIVFFF